MKHLISIFFCFTLFSLFAQNNDKPAINYQGIARYNNGKELANRKLSVTLIIFEDNITNALYEESHNVTTNQFGLFIIEIGRGTTNNNLINLPWNNGKKKFIQTKIDFNNDGIIDLSNKSELLHVPYAFFAENGIPSTHSNFFLPDGSVYLKDAQQGIYLTSPNGSCFFVTVNDSGQLQTVKKPCP